MDDKKTSEESLGQETPKDVSQNQDKKNENPFGENIKPAMYILFDEVKGNFFVLGAPGFLDDMTRAYGALKIAEKNLDEFYSRKKYLRQAFTDGVRDFQSKLNFRRFVRGH